jgi:hypothetical protein
MNARAPQIVAMVLLTLPVVYEICYFSLVAPHGVYTDPFALRGGSLTLARYRAYPGVTEKVFWPVEQFDRWMRPAAWIDNPEPPRDPYWDQRTRLGPYIQPDAAGQRP